MIPKKIHYVWVGNNEKSKKVKKCIKTWKKHLKDYEIIEWNEKNFDINSHPFVKEAYKAKKWAFVSDYIRMYAIYTQGGIYMDTDVIVLSTLDKLLNNRAFVGFETDNIPFTAVFGAEKNHPLIEKIMKSYDKKENSFKPKDANTYLVKEILQEQYKCKLGDEEQQLDDGIHVYPKKILCEPSMKSKTIHVFSGSWLEGKERLINKIDKKFRLMLTNHVIILFYIPFKKMVVWIKKIRRKILNIKN